MQKAAKSSKQLGLEIERDPLSEKEARTLLDPVDVIRDPLHGDIRLTSFERALIDSKEFQRLRNINQLAMTVIAYPSAVHNRFIHSLGTLHVCSEMIATCNENAEVYGRLATMVDAIPVRVNSYATVLARLCALLHDMAHVPFGHTLEKEGRIFEKDEWQDEYRREELLLGPNTPLANLFREFFQSVDLKPESADALRDEIKQVLMTKRADILELRYPFVHDLVGNTICADLIDYVQRDMYFCGLIEQFGKRFLRYLGVMPTIYRDNKDETAHTERVSDGKIFSTQREGESTKACRLVLLQYRYNERRVPVVKHDVIEESIDLVRRRLAVAEKLYFHRTKVVASSMLVSAMHSADIGVKDIWDRSDLEVLKLLETSSQERTRVLAGKLLARHLFKPIYRASYHEKDESHAATLLWDNQTGAYCRFKDPKDRDDLINRLEKIIGLKCCNDISKARGTVSMSCPNENMNVKAFDMLVLERPGSDIHRLHDSRHPATKLEIQAITGTHAHLWRLDVFVDATVVDLTSQFASELAGAIQQKIGPKNEIEPFSNVPSMDLDQLESTALLDHTLKILTASDVIKKKDYEELISATFRMSKQSEYVEHVRKTLRERGYKVPDADQNSTS